MILHYSCFRMFEQLQIKHELLKKHDAFINFIQMLLHQLQNHQVLAQLPFQRIGVASPASLLDYS